MASRDGPKGEPVLVTVGTDLIGANRATARQANPAELGWLPRHGFGAAPASASMLAWAKLKRETMRA